MQKRTGGIAAFSKFSDGTLKLLNKQETQGVACCHLTISPDALYIYAVNYSSGNFAEFKLNEDGSIGERLQVISHDKYPVGPRTDRQECAHTHCSRFTPDGKFICIVDLGVDRILCYPYIPDHGISDNPVVNMTQPGDGPRHIIFTEDGNLAYVVNELGNSVTSYNYYSGKLTKIASFTTLPENFKDATKAAAIRFSPDKRFLYASNRGYDSIACYEITDKGILRLIDIVLSHGISPRDINFLPSGKYFTASNEFSDRICIFAFDEKNGTIRYMDGHDVTEQPRPLCIEY
mgnify:CR=1 FL=1